MHRISNRIWVYDKVKQCFLWGSEVKAESLQAPFYFAQWDTSEYLFAFNKMLLEHIQKFAVLTTKPNVNDKFWKAYN